MGHAGASGYIAVLALAAVPAPEIRAIALLLNVLVASVGTLQFVAAGHFRRDVFVPLALASVPAALVGGAITLPAVLLRQLIGAVLLFSAWRQVGQLPADPGAMRPWACWRGSPAPAAAVSVAFILVNSIAGLAGLVLRHGVAAMPDPGALAPLVGVVLVGGTLGA
ncbi:hypothetical protein [Synechococcus sp. FACHB-909]|uniref:hypothetical protein n=1 Tax=Synechococcus sp. FACHB-909 TaxID=2692863 RepID=UPI00256FB6B5|nr:hypothetical protein [Synechococcus sp. FACHB-909]